jgi:NAD(P)H-dependent FMN reductase
VIRILAISGSLRVNSANTQLLKIISGYATDELEIKLYEGLGDLPHFNDAEKPPPAVLDLNTQIAEADGVLICTPEYAFGIPGVLKNALDWTVGLGSFDKKPVGVITAALAGDKAHASILLVLTALSADVAEGATLLIPFIRSKMNSKGEISDAPTSEAVKKLLNELQIKCENKI